MCVPLWDWAIQICARRPINRGVAKFVDLKCTTLMPPRRSARLAAMAMAAKTRLGPGWDGLVVVPVTIHQKRGDEITTVDIAVRARGAPTPAVYQTPSPDARGTRWAVHRCLLEDDWFRSNTRAYRMTVTSDSSEHWAEFVGACVFSSAVIMMWLHAQVDPATCKPLLELTDEDFWFVKDAFGLRDDETIDICMEPEFEGCSLRPVVVWFYDE